MYVSEFIELPLSEIDDVELKHKRLLFVLNIHLKKINVV